MAFSLKVHEYGRVPGSPFQRIVKATHYVRLTSQGQPPLYIQNGNVYSEGGQYIAHPPDWFVQGLAKLDPKTLESVKYSFTPKKKDETLAQPEAKASTKRKYTKRPKTGVNEESDGDDLPAR